MAGGGHNRYRGPAQEDTVMNKKCVRYGAHVEQKMCSGEDV